MMIITADSKIPVFWKKKSSGKFVVHKTDNTFSAMAIDQCHEQNDAIIKGSGGAVGLTDNPLALRRWMVAGPEITPKKRQRAPSA